MADMKSKVTIRHGKNRTEHHRVTSDQADAVATLLKSQGAGMGGSDNTGPALPNGNKDNPVTTADDGDQSQGA